MSCLGPFYSPVGGRERESFLACCLSVEESNCTTGTQCSTHVLFFSYVGYGAYFVTLRSVQCVFGTGVAGWCV